MLGKGFFHVGLADIATGSFDDDLAGRHLDEALALFRKGAIRDGLEAVEERRRRLGSYGGP